MELYRPQSHQEDARRLTQSLRTSDKPEWIAVRGFLTDAGFDPEKSAVGDLFPEQSGDFGVLVTADRRIFTFEVGSEPVRGERGKRRWWVTHEELVDAGNRFAYARAAFAAMKFLEAEQPSGSRPLEVLVEYVAALTAKFRGTAERRSADRWDAEDYWDVLHAFMRQHSFDPMETVALDWAVRATSEVDDILVDIDGGLLVPPDEPVRGYAASSLGLLGGPRAKEILDRAYAREAAPRVRVGLAVARYRLGERSALADVPRYVRSGDEDLATVILNELEVLLDRDPPSSLRDDMEQIRMTLEEASRFAILRSQVESIRGRINRSSDAEPEEKP